jgi:lysophospholipid acyltransferase (LPLAT)-like uncharacterized protein
MARQKLSKRIAKSEATLAFMTWFASLYIRMLARLVSWKRDYHPEARALIEGQGPFIACFWHGRMLMMSAAWPNDPKDMHLLISLHRDGRLIADAVQKLGYAVVEGSSRRGGLQAFLEMARVLKEGKAVAITPDGPRGPRMRVKPGILKAAQFSGVPIVPIAGSASSRWMLKTWDRFLIPKPFSKGILLAGEPLRVGRELDEKALDTLRADLEQRLNALCDAADDLVGQTAIAPDPVEA